MKKIVTTLAVGAVAALAIGGTALAGGDDDTAAARLGAAPSASASASAPAEPGEPGSVTEVPGVAPSASASSSASASASAPAGAVRADQARTVALRAAGGGQVTGIERETEHGRAVWDVEVRVGDVEHEIDVDRENGRVLRHRTDADDDRADARDDHGADDRGGDRGDHGADDRGGDRGGHGADDRSGKRHDDRDDRGDDD